MVAPSSVMSLAACLQCHARPLSHMGAPLCDDNNDPRRSAAPLPPGGAHPGHQLVIHSADESRKHQGVMDDFSSLLSRLHPYCGGSESIVPSRNHHAFPTVPTRQTLLPPSRSTASCDLHPQPWQRHEDAAVRCVNTLQGLTGSRRWPLQPIKAKKAEREMDKKEDEREEAKTATASLREVGRAAAAAAAAGPTQPLTDPQTHILQLLVSTTLLLPQSHCPPLFLLTHSLSRTDLLSGDPDQDTLASAWEVRVVNHPA